MSGVYFQAWRVNVGRVPVYLLDTNLPGERAAFPRFDRARLWRRQHHAHHAGNFAGHRRRALAARAGRRSPRSFHMNEGHAAFLTLELIREKMAAGKTFAEAQAQTKAGMHFHHPHAGRGRPRPLHAGADGLRPAALSSAN